MADHGIAVPSTSVIPKWHPHQLRHKAGTIVREEIGAEASQIHLGHATLDATLIYAERNAKMAREIAMKIG